MLWHEIVCVLLLVWIDASFRSIDVALSVLSNWILLFNVKSVLLNLTLLILIFSSVINCDVFVRILFVHFSQMLLSKFQDLVTNVSNISFFRSFFDFKTNHWILFKDFFKQELFLKLHCFHILFSGVDEFTFFVEANIVITNIRILMKFNWRICRVLTRCLDHTIVSDGYSSFLDEIHVRNLIFFI